MAIPDDIEVVRTFHDRLAARDVPAMLDLAADDIRVGGGRGSNVGKGFFEEWIAHASLTLEPTRWFRRVDEEREGRHGVRGEVASTVAVEERAIWRAAQSGRETGRMTFAAVYEIRNGALASIARYNNIGEAVNTAGLDEDNEIDLPAHG